MDGIFRPYAGAARGVSKRDSQTLERRWCVRLVHIGDVIVLHGLHERFGHAIAQRQTYWCGQRLKTRFASEAARAVVDVGRAVARQPFDGPRGLRRAEALFDGGQHHVVHHISAMSGGLCRPANRLPVAAVQRERYARRRAIGAPEPKAIGAPAGVAAGDRNTTVTPPLVSPHAGAYI